MSRYDERFTDCRDFGHAWTVKSVVVVDHRPLTYERKFKCLRGCGTERRETFVSNTLSTRGYRYDDDYQWKKITPDGRSKAVAEIRAKNLRRYARTKPSRLRSVS